MPIYRGKNSVFTAIQGNNKINQMFVGTELIFGEPVQPPSVFFNATGGTITYDGDYKIHTFTTPSIDFTFDVLSLGTAPYNYVEVLVVGGGGGGGARAGGGGGGGGMVYISEADAWNDFEVRTYNKVRVGGGGDGAIDGVIGSGANGGDSYIGYNLVSPVFFLKGKGGGGGGGFPYATGAGDGEVGGSGGGGQSYSAVIRGTENQSLQSGDSGTYAFSSDGAPAISSGGIGGGGGGAGGVAPSGTPNDDSYIDGADGKQISISGVPTYYAGGGGGGDDCASASWGLGGLGGGGRGAECDEVPNTNTQGVDGLGGGGGGGGGGFEDGSDGGSGIIVIRYQYQ